MHRIPTPANKKWLSHAVWIAAASQYERVRMSTNEYEMYVKHICFTHIQKYWPVQMNTIALPTQNDHIHRFLQFCQQGIDVTSCADHN